MKKHTGYILAATLSLAILTGAAGCNETLANTGDPKATQVPYLSEVEAFLRESETFKFDGIQGSIRFPQVIGSADGNNPAPVDDWEFTVVYQTAHPGHGDRSGEMLAQVITGHALKVTVKDGEIASAVCDETYDMINEKDTVVSVVGLIRGGGATTPESILDVPRRFVYKIEQADGTLVNVAYTGYPPSPVGDIEMAKIELDFFHGVVSIFDYMEARGTFDAATNTLTVANEGDYIRTFPEKP